MNFQRHNREAFGDARPKNPSRVPILEKVTDGSMTPEKWAGVAFIILIMVVVVVCSYRKGVQDYENLERQKLLEGNPHAPKARIEGGKKRRNDKRKKIKSN